VRREELGADGFQLDLDGAEVRQRLSSRCEGDAKVISLKASGSRRPTSRVGTSSETRRLVPIAPENPLAAASRPNASSALISVDKKGDATSVEIRRLVRHPIAATHSSLMRWGGNIRTSTVARAGLGSGSRSR
jgi:hypothetical protein